MKNIIRIVVVIIIIGLAAFFYYINRVGIPIDSSQMPQVDQTPKENPAPVPKSTLSLDSSSASAVVGADVVISAMIDPASEKVSATELHLNYDHSKFRLDKVSTVGSPFSVTLAPAAIDNAKGSASIAVGVPLKNPATPVTEKSVVATFTFRVLSAGSSAVSFANESIAYALGKDENVIGKRTGVVINQ